MISRRSLVLGGMAAATLAGSRALALTGLQRMWLQTDNSGKSFTSHSFEDGDMCVATAATTQGPYYADGALERPDMREDREGAPLDLELKVVDAGSCRLLSGRPVVELWHCDARGYYSRYRYDPMEWPTRTAPAQTDNETWLRGRQRAGAGGLVRFRTIYPGWYASRAHHIHGKVWTSPGKAFTFQLYFPEELNREVTLRPPYSQRSPNPYPNVKDYVIGRSGADGSFLKMSRVGDGFRGALTIGVPAGG